MRRSGSKLGAVLLALALPLAAQIPGYGPGRGEQVSKKSKKEPPHGMVSGTIFRDPGFAFPGAQVTLTSVDQPAGDAKPIRERVISDDRGEFAFRVPPVEMHYKVSVAAKGFQPQEKSVEIRGEEQVDATFMLEPESK